MYMYMGYNMCIYIYIYTYIYMYIHIYMYDYMIMYIITCHIVMPHATSLRDRRLPRSVRATPRRLARQVHESTTN